MNQDAAKRGLSTQLTRGSDGELDGKRCVLGDPGVRARPVKDHFVEAVQRMAPDVLLLNEYVHGKTRAPVLKALANQGLVHVLVSEPVGSNNQVLIASRMSLSIHEASEELQREPVSVLGRISAIGAFEFECGTEEWVEIMSLALSGVPLQDVIAWCSASEERMPFELFDAMRSGPDQRPAFELARELGIEVANVYALADLQWLIGQPQEVRVGHAAAAARVVARFDALTPATLKSEVLGLAPADLRWMGGEAPKKNRGSKTPKAGAAKARAPGKASASRARKPKIRNRWAFANYVKKKRASASGNT